MWKKCSSCRTPINFGDRYWLCSVSTCQRSRTGLYFCVVNCWDAHLGTANHREAWAVEATAPSKAQWDAIESAAPESSKPATAETRRPVAAGARKVVASGHSSAAPKDVLLVVSKLKKYIKEAHGLRTSDDCMDVLSDYVRTLCDRAVANAHGAERKTVLGRDFRGVL